MKPALLLIDLQQDFLTTPDLQPAAPALIERAAALLASCRQQNIPIVHIYTTVQRNPDNRMPHWKAANRWMCEQNTPGHQPPAALLPAPGETIIHKQFFSAFTAPQLDDFLRAQQCDTLYLAGLHLHACIRATALDAYARNLTVLIADDAIASDDPLHAAITRRYLTQRGIFFKPINNIEWCHASAAQFAAEACRTTASVSQATLAARRAQESFRHLPIHTRAFILHSLADLLLQSAPQLAHQISTDIHKPITMAHAEVQRSAAILRAVAAEADKPLESPSGPDARLRHQPLGVVAIITPFNNPLAIPIGKIAPAILFGNTVVWKPAPAGAAIAQTILTLARTAGWHTNNLDILHLVTGDSSVAMALAADPNIDAVTVSASLTAGYALQEICARRHIPFQAELGGNNPAIVWHDTDLTEAARQIAAGAFGFAGQRCTANRRAIIDSTCFDTFLSHLQIATAALPWGPPSDPNTIVGPLLHTAKRDHVAALLARTRIDCQIVTPHATQSNYATLMQSGPYHPPAIVLCDNPAHEIVQEETFGPVLVLQRATTFDHALQLANGVRQGLVAALFSPNPDLQQKFLATAQAGVLKLNRSTVDADASSPLGGWKASGLGPPEHGPSDREFFTRIQTIYGA